jgi:hypothetical protein
MKRALIVACFVAVGSVVSQAAGLQLGNGPVVNASLQSGGLVTVVKANSGVPNGLYERVLSNPGQANGRVRILSRQDDPEGGWNGGGGSRPNVPEPEGWAAALALGLAGLIFGGYRFKRRLVCDVA